MLVLGTDWVQFGKLALAHPSVGSQLPGLRCSVLPPVSWMLLFVSFVVVQLFDDADHVLGHASLLPVAFLPTNILNNSTVFPSAIFAATEKSKWEDLVRKKGRKAVGEPGLSGFSQRPGSTQTQLSLMGSHVQLCAP